MSRFPLAVTHTPVSWLGWVIVYFQVQGQRNVTLLNPLFYSLQMIYKITITRIHTHTCKNNHIAPDGAAVYAYMLATSVCISLCVRARVCARFKGSHTSVCVCFVIHPSLLCWGTVPLHLTHPPSPSLPILMNAVKLVRHWDSGCFLPGFLRLNLMCRRMMYWKPPHQGVAHMRLGRLARCVPTVYERRWQRRWWRGGCWGVGLDEVVFSLGNCVFQQYGYCRLWQKE